MSGVKTTGGVGSSGLFGLRSQGSGSKLDGTIFVAPTSTESRLLRKAFKGQGSVNTVLTVTPNGPLVGRHGQTGLFNLSSFQKVKTVEPPARENEQLDHPEFHEQPDPPQVQGQEGNGLAPPPHPPLDVRVETAMGEVDDFGNEFLEWHRRSTGSKDERGDIIARDRFSTALAARATELHKLEREVRDQPESSLRTQMLEELKRAREDVMAMTVLLELPGLDVDALEPSKQLQELAGRLVELEDKLRAAREGDPKLSKTPLGLDKLVAILADFGRTRELSQSSLPGQRTDALEGLTGLVETIVEAVGPGRDGVELNSLFGLNVELDTVLKEARFGAICQLLRDDLGRDRDLQDAPLTHDELDKIETDARELVELDYEIAQCQRQIGRALRAGKFGDLAGQVDYFFTRSKDTVALDDLVGKVGDTGLIKGLRERFGKEGEHVGVLLSALKEVTRLARDCEGAQRVRRALDRELTQKQDELGQLHLQYGQQLRDLSDLSTRIRDLDRQAQEARDRNDNLPHEAFAGMIEALLAEAGVIEGEIAPLRTLERDMNLLRERIDSLMPEPERVARELEAAIEAETRLLEQKTHLEETLQNLNQAIDAGPPEDVRNLEALRDELRPLLEEITKRHGYAQNAVESWQSRQDILDFDTQRAGWERAIEEAQARIGSLTGELDRVSRELGLVTREIDRVSTLIDQRRNPTGEDLSEMLEDLYVRYGDLEDERRALEGALGAQIGTIETAQAERLRLSERNPWSAGGLSPVEIAQLNMSGSESGEILKTARSLARQGITNTGQVLQLCRDINSVVRTIGEVGARSSQGIENQLNVVNARSNEEVARRFAGTLMGSLLGESVGDLGSPNLKERMNEALVGENGGLSTLTEQLRQNPNESQLFALDQQYGQVETSLLARIEGFEEILVDRGEARRIVTAFAGRTIDPRHPTGLRISEAFEDICLLRDQCGGDPNNLTDEQRARFNALARQLRGFDPQRLDTRFPQFVHPVPTMQDVTGWLDQHPHLRDTARAIITLRQGEQPYEDHFIEVARQVAQLDRIGAQRLEVMGSAGEVLRDAIRAAILHRLVTTGSKVDEFKPSDHAREIRQTLRDWGVPVDDVMPEIDRLLSESFGPNELNLWLETTTPSRDYLQSVGVDKSLEVSELEGSNETGGLDPETLQALFESIDSLQPGTNMKLFVGSRGDIQTGRLNTPAPLVRYNVRGGFGGINGLEIARSSSDGYEIIIRQGYECRVGTDITVGGSPGGGLLGATRLEVVGSVEGAGSRVTGVTLRFRNDKDGCQAMKQTLTNLLTTGGITPQDLSSVDNLLPIVEHKGSLKVGVTGQARFLGSGVSRKLTPWAPSGQARVGVSLTGAGKWYTAQNTNLTVEKTDTDKTVEVGFGLSVYTSNPTGHPINHPLSGSNMDPNLAGFDVQGGISWLFRTKTKQTRGLDGLITTGTEIQHQRTLSLGWNGMTAAQRMEQLKTLGGPAFVRMLDRLSDTQRAGVEKMLLSAGANDMINVGFALDERVRAAINALLEQAKAIRSGRIPSESRSEAEAQARALEARAQRLLDDPDNYNPSKLQLIPTRENQQALSMNLLGIFKLERYVEDRSEWVALEMKFDAILGQEVRNELTGI